MIEREMRFPRRWLAWMGLFMAVFLAGLVWETTLPSKPLPWFVPWIYVPIFAFVGIQLLRFRVRFDARGLTGRGLMRAEHFLAWSEMESVQLVGGRARAIPITKRGGTKRDDLVIVVGWLSRDDRTELSKALRENAPQATFGF